MILSFGRLLRGRVPAIVAAAALAAAALATGAVSAAAADPPCLPTITCPSPSPSPTPSPRPTPSPTPAPAPRPTSAPAAAQPKAAPSPSPSPSAATQVAARFQNAPFLTDLLKVINHPVSAQTPDLKHFRLEAARVAAVKAQAGRERAARDNRAAATTVFLVAVVGLAGATAALWFAGGRVPPRLRRAGLLLLPALAASVTAGLQPQRVPPPSRPVAGVASTAATPPRAVSPIETAPAWQELVAVETELAVNQDLLQRQEDLIRKTAFNPDLSSADSPTVEPPAAPVVETPDSVRMDGAARQQARIGRLLDAYRDATARFQESLKREYELYRGAARDPERKQQIVAAATISPAHDAREAVTYNLTVVQAALDQEAQITAAEGKLQALGSLSGAQLDAIRKHQPFIVPIQGQMVQGFGPTDVGFEPAATYHGTFYPHFHSGLDLDAPENTPVHAAADGVVLLATSSHDSQGNLVGYGNYVVIAHPNGFVTLYGHLNGFSVREGQVVHQGEIIGQEGSTGLSTGPHVHFEIRHNDDWVDPAPYLAGQLST